MQKSLWKQMLKQQSFEGLLKFTKLICVCFTGELSFPQNWAFQIDVNLSDNSSSTELLISLTLQDSVSKSVHGFIGMKLWDVRCSQR